MASGTIPVSGSGFSGYIVWSSTRNGWTSTVNATLYISRSAGPATTRQQGSGSIKIGGNTGVGSIPTGSAGLGQTFAVCSTSATVGHGANGSATVSISASFSGNYIVEGTTVASGSASGSGTAAMDTIWPYFTFAPTTFTDEDNPTVKFYNPYNINYVSKIQAGISSANNAKADLVPMREIDKNLTEYTFQLTEEEREALCDSTPNSNSRTVYFCLEIVVSGSQRVCTLGRTLTIVDAEPIITASFIDTNRTSIGLTGDANILVRYLSNVQVTADFEAKKGATINLDTYVVRNGDGLPQYSNPAIFEDVESGKFTFSVEDSRGNIASTEIEAEIVPYVPLTCNLETAHTIVGEGAEVTLTVTGKGFSGSFGAKKNVLSVSYSYREKGETQWGPFQSMTVTTDGDDYEAIAVVEVDYRKTYEFWAHASDRVGGAESVAQIISFIPVFNWGEDFFNINADLNVNGAITLNGEPFAGGGGAAGGVARISVVANDTIPFTLEDGGLCHIGYTTSAKSGDIYLKVNGNLPNTAYTYFYSSGGVTNNVFCRAGGNHAGTFDGWITARDGIVEVWGSIRRGDTTYGWTGDAHLTWNVAEVSSIAISAPGALYITKLA